MARGQTYTFKQGESVSILFVFDSTYNPNRIDDIAVAIGSKSVGSLADGKIQTTANTRQFKLQLTSAETKNSFGGALIISVEDSILGVKKVDAGQIKFVSSSQFNNSAVNTGTDLTVSLEIEEAGITSNATLATIFKGDRGDTGATGAQGANAQNPNFSVATGTAGSNVSVSGSYPNLTLTIPRGDTGANATNPNFTAATGAAGSSATITGTYPNLTLTVPRGDTGATGASGSDANVTSGNIASALGYTPVSPTQLGAKQDTSASITTAKISDWTTAWAARWAATAVALSSNLIPSGTRNLGGTAVGQHWNLLYVRSIVSEASVLTMQGGASRIALDPNTVGTNPRIQIGFNNSNTTACLAKIGYTTFISNNINQYGLDVAPNVNQSGTASYTISRISPRIIASVGNNNRLFSVGYNDADYGAGNHTEVLGVNTSGILVSGVSLFNTTTNNGLGTAAQFNGTVYVDSKINMATGSNKALNTVTLSGGTVTVNNTLVTASSIISLTYQNCSNCGTAYISAKTAGTSFVITSTNASDASTIAYEIKN